MKKHVSYSECPKVFVGTLHGVSLRTPRALEIDQQDLRGKFRPRQLEGLCSLFGKDTSIGKPSGKETYER